MDIKLQIILYKEYLLENIGTNYNMLNLLIFHVMTM